MDFRTSVGRASQFAETGDGFFERGRPVDDPPALVFIGSQGFAFVLLTRNRPGIAEHSNTRMELGPAVEKTDLASLVASPDFEHSGNLAAARPEDRQNLVSNRGEEAPAGVGNTDFQAGGVPRTRPDHPEPQALAGFEQFPMGRSVGRNLREHDPERRTVKRGLLVQDSLHLRVPESSSDPEEQQGCQEKAARRRCPELLLPKQWLAQKFLRQGTVLKF